MNPDHQQVLSASQTPPVREGNAVSQPTLSDSWLRQGISQGLAGGAAPTSPSTHDDAPRTELGGAPKKRPTLTDRITLRLPADIAVDWRRQADHADRSLSDWIRYRVEHSDAVLTGKLRRKRRLRTLTADPGLLRQLAALGSNINQIARMLNSVGLAPSDQIWLLAELSSIQGELHRLAELPRYNKTNEDKEQEPCTSGS
jgi:hypothetical protein